MSLPIVILAGGLATRLGAIGVRTPKALIEVAGKPFAVHQIDELRRQCVTDIVFCLGHHGDLVASTLGDGERWGVQIRYVFDGPRALGTGGALRGAVTMLGEVFFVMYGDAYLCCDYAAVERAFRAGGKLALMTVIRNENRWDRSNVLFDEGRIIRYDKRHRAADMKHIDYGLGVMRADGLRRYPEQQPIDLASIYQDLLTEGQLAGFEVGERFFEIGSIDGLDETRHHIEHRMMQ